MSEPTPTPPVEPSEPDVGDDHAVPSDRIDQTPEPSPR